MYLWDQELSYDERGVTIQRRKNNVHDARKLPCCGFFVCYVVGYAQCLVAGKQLRTRKYTSQLRAFSPPAKRPKPS
jgi:hypothetical protein